MSAPVARSSRQPAAPAAAGTAPAGRPPRKTFHQRHPRLRRGVGIVVMNSHGQVLAGLRFHAKLEPAGHAAWQLPQGGIEGREKPLSTAYRELQEETGLLPEDVELVHELPRWTRYFLPKEWQSGKRFIGQTQRWYLFRAKSDLVPDIKRALHQEFTQLDWVEVNWLVGHVIAFRQPVYRQVFRNFAPYLNPDQAPDQTPENPSAAG